MAKSAKTIAVGIDLGTTNCCAAIIEDGGIVIVPDDQGRRTMPSMYTQINDQEALVGWDAFSQAHIYPRQTAYDIKRLIGQNFDNEDVQNFRKKCTYDIFDDNNIIQIRLADIEFYPEEISGRILSRIKQVVEDYTQKEVSQAVITVPAYFGDSQRNATIDAAVLAGFEKIRTINEPTAAALAFQHNNPIDKKQTILIYDFGGGTFDVTVAETIGKNCKVLATKGNCFLGGIDIDMNILDYIRAKISKESYKMDYRKSISIVEEAKKWLSTVRNCEIIINDQPVTLSRDDIYRINEDLFQETITIAKKCVEDAGLELKDIDVIVPIGGSSRIPKLREIMRQVFKNSRISETVHPDQAVAYGAALFATNIFTERQELNIEDVLSLSLGIEIGLGEMYFILKRNTSVPCEHKETFSVSSSSFVLKLYQGESLLAENNYFLGQFIIDNKQNAKAITITFSFDKAGILTVMAHTDNEIQLKIDMTKRKINEEEKNRLLNYEKEAGTEFKYLEFVKKKHSFDFYCEDLSLKIKQHYNRKKILKEINTCKKEINRLSPNDTLKFDEWKRKLETLYNKQKSGFLRLTSWSKNKEFSPE